MLCERTLGWSEINMLAWQDLVMYTVQGYQQNMRL